MDNDRNSAEVEGTISSSTIPANFVLFDDDDYNNNDNEIIKGKNTLKPDGDDNEFITSIPGLLSLFENSDLLAKNAYAEAYIKPVYDGGGSVLNNTPNVAFDLNISYEKVAFDTQVNLGKQSTAASDDFWVIYLQICYQGDIIKDRDPNIELPTLGITYSIALDDGVTSEADVPEGADETLIFLEPLSEEGDFALSKVVIPHEVGHMFGLAGDNANGTDIMVKCNQQVSPWIAKQKKPTIKIGLDSNLE